MYGKKFYKNTIPNLLMIKLGLKKEKWNMSNQMKN